VLFYLFLVVIRLYLQLVMARFSKANVDVRGLN